MALIDVRHLHCARRLADVSFALAPGEILGVIGPNGAGKSSLLQCLAGILDYQGEVDFEGHALAGLAMRQRAQRIGFLPQSSGSAWALQVEDVVALGRLPWGDNNPQALRDAARQAGIETLLGRRVDRLSGGEQARVWLARVLAGQPRLLLADEPIASLDLLHQRSVMEALRTYADGERGVILSIHDFGLAARYCDRLCLLREGAIHALGRPAEVLTEHHLSEVFQVPVHVDLVANPPVVALK
ncbi:ABC transporter ATP-binding protein [Noviherbaspirillum cavernae]|uniref:ABC transporter ATP-binding protein n=1 Tax=Noviherbaspirillum cavernae TaxID=2320862 RepID=A0A418WZJ9_9BURK|nr:ABC transporter ATP-binding protein [Noviherbaspirillum cavernae]RJG05621.1 ABC transporter ATP-binding protein [Noviherbaspirillum cavernae]